MATKKTAPKGKVLALVCKCGDCSHWELLLDKTGDYTQTLLKCVSCGDTHPVSFEIDAHENLHYKKV
jgi:ribosomal protein S27E